MHPDKNHDKQELAQRAMDGKKLFIKFMVQQIKSSRNETDSLLTFTGLQRVWSRNEPNYYFLSLKRFFGRGRPNDYDSYFGGIMGIKKNHISKILHHILQTFDQLKY